MAISSRWYVPAFSKDFPRPIALCSPYDSKYDDAALLPAEPLTISLCSAKVCKQWSHGILGLVGKASTNNLLIRSLAAVGKDIEVERVHFYDADVQPKTLLTDVEYPTIHVSPDYKAADRLWLEVEIVEIELHQHDSDVLEKSIEHFATTVGGAFPIVTPYAAASTGLLTAAETLIESLKKNTSVLKAHITLFPKGWEGITLRRGDYVLFNEEVDGSQYTLNEEGELLIQDSAKPAEIDYVVLTVAAQQVDGPDYPAQQAAKLLTQLHADQTNGSTAGVDFLTNTLKQYNLFEDLKRYNELRQKPADKLTPTEKKLMDTIAGKPELKDFLPQ